MEGNGQFFSLRWNNYLRHMAGAFESLLSEQDFVDVTLSCEGKKINAHKMLLSACSSYFRDLFKENPCQHPVIVFRNVHYEDLAALVSFIYQGEVSIVQEQLASFLATAELLQVKGLTDGDSLKKEQTTEHDVKVKEDPRQDSCVVDAGSQNMIEKLKSEISLTPVSTRLSPEPSMKKRKSDFDSDSSLGSSRTKRYEQREIPALSLLPSGSHQSVEIIPVTPNLEVDETGPYFKAEPLYEGSPNSDVPQMDMPEYFTQRSRRTMEAKHEDITEYYNGGNSDDGSQNAESDTGQQASSRSTVTGSDLSQDTIQGHWLSPLSTESAMNQKHRYVCNICGATYKHLRNLRAHCHLHYGKTRCNLCNKVLCNISYFKKHLQQQHGMLTDYSTKK